MYIAYFNEKKPWIPLIPWVSFDTARFTVRVRVYPQRVTVCAGSGTVWENPTRGIPVLNASLHMYLFPMFRTFLIHNLIHQLAIHVNLDYYLLHRHLYPTLLQPQIKEMPTSTRRLDSPTLFPSQQIILMLLMLSQMLIQGECLLWMKNQMNKT